MNRNKLMLVLAGVAALVIIAGGLLLGVQPQLAQASSDRAQRAEIDQTNATKRQELTRLAAADAKLPETKAELERLVAAVPASPDTASFIRELYTVASASDVTISNITTGDPVAYVTPVPVAGSPSNAASTATAAPSAAATPSAVASPSVPAAPPAVTDPQVTSANFSTIQMSLSVAGSYDQALAFTSGVQHGERLFLVNAISSSGSTDGGSSVGDPVWTLSGFIYVFSNATATPSATPAAG